MSEFLQKTNLAKSFWWVASVRRDVSIKRRASSDKNVVSEIVRLENHLKIKTKQLLSERNKQNVQQTINIR